EEEDLALRLEHGDEELRADVDRQRWPIALGVGEPFGVVLAEELGEVLAQALLEVAQRLEQAGLLRGGEPHLPARELHHQLDPLPPRQRRPAPRLELAEARHEVARQALLAE